MKRTHLPLNALRVFDAAARHLSFTRAADELAVTPAAVGQQIRALEDVLGVVLFRRTSKGLELTDEAEAGLDPLREGFLGSRKRSRRCRPANRAMSIPSPPRANSIAQWLAPRLAAFRAANPEVRYQLSPTRMPTSPRPTSISRSAGRRAGRAGRRAACRRSRVVVAARRAPDGWIAWPGAPLPEGSRARVLQVGNAGQALLGASPGSARRCHAAAAGAPSLADGRLVCWTEPEDCRRAYWLVAPRPQWRQKKVKALVEAGHRR
jgi:DNA-binding transcriptional LysR family regulator